METKATAKYVRISPTKVRRVTAEITGLPVARAQAILQFMPGRGPRVVAKALKSAVANAENNLDLNRDDLVVTRAYADTGPSQKRLMPRARGRMDVMVKRSSHVTVVVGEQKTAAPRRTSRR